MKKPQFLRTSILISVALLAVVLWSGNNFENNLTTVFAQAPNPPQDPSATNKIYIPAVNKPATATPLSSSDWPMLAGNVERTSWNTEEVRGGLSVAWYHPIEPYIPTKVQPIAANGKIYVSTASGLYTFNASNGSLAWVYPTELPLGHSPTIATINGTSVAFVGGYDRKIHAIDAITGQDIAGYTAYNAGAGFDTNPLVINNVIYSGNRDGYFYAINAVTGGLVWRYKTDGPIFYSAAYKNGVVYFASNDAFGYALNATSGSLIWKSQKLLGSGFHSFWPVIYTNKSSGKDYIIFTSGTNLKYSAMSLTEDETGGLFAVYQPAISSAQPAIPSPVIGLLAHR